MLGGTSVTRHRNWIPLLGLTALLASSAQASPVRELGRITAKSAILIDNGSGEVLFARNPHLQLPPASTTKMLTALVALRTGLLHRDLPVSRYASSMQPAKIWLQPGWRMNVEDLVYATLLNSANDASVVLAEGLAGSVPRFADLMNATAYELGATRSHFVNPSGLPEEGHLSTARDLATLMHHALQIPRLREILSTQSTVITPRAGSNRRIVLRSHNRLLGRRDMKVIGKTGWTRSAKRCFVGAAANDRREVVVAVLGSVDLWGDLERLIAYGLGQPPAGPSWATETRWQEAAARGGAVPQPERSAPGDREDTRDAAFRYHLHLASFARAAEAGRLQQRVAERGYEAVVERIGTKRRPLYRVTVRDFPSKGSARAAARTLGQAYRLQPQIVAERV